MKRYTVNDIMAAGPCSRYPRERVEELWAGRDGLTAEEIASLDIAVEDRLWAVLHICLDDRTRRLYACDCAERALNRERALGREPDPRSIAAIEVARRYASGSATPEELAAARAAAMAAAMDAAMAAAMAAARDSAMAAARDSAMDACDAARAAAWAAAWAAASAAAMAAAWDAERAWQLTRAVELAYGGEK